MSKVKTTTQKSKLKKLHDILKNMGSVLVAYSGGLDSAFLLKACVDALGRENVLAVTARSETYPLSEYKEAIEVARKIGARHLTINTSELGIKNFKENPEDRCYYCKKELFSKLADIAKESRMSSVLDGTNYDDLKDVRHGRRAAKEIGIKSPLLDAGIGKDDIRKFSKSLKLPTWHKPSYACLASRIPFNTPITAEKLGDVERAEEFLKKFGFWQVRVRHHGNIARIELDVNDLPKALKPRIRDEIVAGMKTIGFKYVTLDLQGYRTGSMH